MASETQAIPASKKLLWAGWIIALPPVFMLLMSATMKFLHPPFVTKGNAELGWPDSVMLPLGITEVACTVLYLVPRTSVLGAILITGYLGGATAAHVRVQEAQFIVPVLLGVLLWLGLFLRDARLRALLPLRS